MIRDLIINSEKEMENLGFRFFEMMREGGCVALYGDLGSGKSVFVRGLAKAFGITSVTSPTFTIIQRYDSEPPFYHIDAYRLGSADELYDAGFSDCLRDKSVVAIEWADLVENVLPSKRISIKVKGSGMEPRHVLIEVPDSVYSAGKWKTL